MNTMLKTLLSPVVFASSFTVHHVHTLHDHHAHRPFCRSA